MPPRVTESKRRHWESEGIKRPFRGSLHSVCRRPRRWGPGRGRGGGCPRWRGSLGPGAPDPGARRASLGARPSPLQPLPLRPRCPTASCWETWNTGTGGWNTQHTPERTPRREPLSAALKPTNTFNLTSGNSRRKSHRKLHCKFNRCNGRLDQFL